VGSLTKIGKTLNLIAGGIDMGRKNRSWIQLDRDAEKHFLEWVKRTNSEQMYMHTNTGSVDNYDGWEYEDENRRKVNAVDLNEVVPVFWDKNNEQWEEV